MTESNSVTGLHSRPEMTENRINELEDSTIEFTHHEKREKVDWKNAKVLSKTNKKFK